MGRRRTPVVWSVVLASLLIGVTSCGDQTRTDRPVAEPTVLPLPDGVLDPGRYRFVVRVECAGVTDDPIACPEGIADPPPIAVDVSVPDGWQHLADFPVITTVGGGTEEGALVLGWTSNTVGVHSDPCSSRSHALPDVQVGPGVDDFVDAVVSQPWFEGTAPVDTQVGHASGRYFTLTGPADLGACLEWRPWDPGFYAQGPSNTWEVWVLDVDGHRVVVVADYFPGTPEDTVAQLHQMVESLRFPSDQRASAVAVSRRVPTFAHEFADHRLPGPWTPGSRPWPTG